MTGIGESIIDLRTFTRVPGERDIIQTLVMASESQSPIDLHGADRIKILFPPIQTPKSAKQSLFNKYERMKQFFLQTAAQFTQKHSASRLPNE